MFTMDYPYMPDGRAFRFVRADDFFIRAAALARQECAGDSLFPVGAVLVRDGQVVARAGNGYNRGSGTRHVCPRIVLECPSGTGYEMCDLHDAPGHAEPMLMAVANEEGIQTDGADVYLYGHWWCCEPCWGAMIDGGVRDVYLLVNAREEFHRDRVYGETLAPRVKRAYIACAYTHNSALDQNKPVYEALGAVCEELGCKAVIPFRDNPENAKPLEKRNVKRVYQWTKDELRATDVLIADVSNQSLGAGCELGLARKLGKPIVLVSKKGSVVSSFALGTPNVAYHIQYDDLKQACRMLRNILWQL